MIYVKKVEGTLKQGVHAELGPRTVIYGPNGAGKSSIIQSLELATCGHVSDVEGREQVKHAHAIGRLFRSDEDIFVEVTLSDDTKFRWSMERQKEEGYKRPEHECPRRVIWPVQDLKAVLTGDANSVQAWLEQQVIGTISEADLLRSLPPSTHDAVKQLAKKFKKNDFMALAKEAKSTARSLRTDATKTENTVEAMMQSVPLPLMADERAALDRRLAELEATNQVGVTQGQKAIWQSELDALVSRRAEVQAQRDALQLPTDKDYQAAKTVGSALTLVRTHAKELGLDICWTCGNDKPNFQGHVERLVQAESKLQVFADALKNQTKLDQELTDLSAKIQRLEESLVTAVIESSTAERDAIFRQIAADDTAKRSWANANSQRADVDRQRLQADALTLAAKALEKAGKDLLERRKSEFEAEVNRFLPTGDRFAVDLDSARIGLLRDGQIHSALSGAEWSRVLLALAASRSNGSTPCVLAPEDRAWDRDTLSRVMTALADSEVQIILMSTIKPEPVAGWKILDLTDER
jgi:DNA repair exonuclease SbcCD ATPase subunit